MFFLSQGRSNDTNEYCFKWILLYILHLLRLDGKARREYLH